MMYSLNRTLQTFNWRVIFNIIGHVLMIEGCLLLFPLIVDLIYSQHVWDAYLKTIVICLVIGFPLSRMKEKHKSYFAKDGFVAVGLSWAILSFFGGLPFFFTQEIPSLVDCFFETVSGFTTTGSSILTDVEALSQASLLWRSFTHWVGGMGVLVFILAIIPRSNDRTMHIMRAEAPGPVIGKLVPRLKDSAAILYKIYFVLTIIMILFLLAGGMPLFDSLCTAFGTAGTGGFSIKNVGMAYYNSVYLEMVVTFFMLLFGINFNLFYFLLIKNVKAVWKNEELRTYLIIVAFSILMIMCNIVHLYDNSWFEAFRYASFQVASIISTTGFSSTDFNLWPQFSKMVLLLLMIIGACAGSTAGGIKVSRFLILLKKTKLDIQRLLHPQKVEAITMDQKIVDEQVVHQILSYFFCFMLILGSILLIVSLDDFDLETTLSACFTCIGNVGPGLGMAGPLSNFSMFSDLSKIVLSFAMLIGRLEIYPIIIFIVPLFATRKTKRHRD